MFIIVTKATAVQYDRFGDFFIKFGNSSTISTSFNSGFCCCPYRKIFSGIHPLLCYYFPLLSPQRELTSSNQVRVNPPLWLLSASPSSINNIVGLKSTSANICPLHLKDICWVIMEHFPTIGQSQKYNLLFIDDTLVFFFLIEISFSPCPNVEHDDELCVWDIWSRISGWLFISGYSWLVSVAEVGKRLSLNTLRFFN